MSKQPWRDLPAAPGSAGVYRTVVSSDLTAHHFGNPDVHVLATCMVGLFAERALNSILHPLLQADFGVVGVRQQVHHRAPAPAGTIVVTTLTLTEVGNRRIGYTFRTQTEAGELLGEGEGESALVVTGRFLARAGARVGVEGSQRPGI